MVCWKQRKPVLNKRKKTSLPRWLLFAASLLSAVCAVLFALLYYNLYWRYRTLFNEQGRYFDAKEMVVHDDSAFVFIVPAVILGCLALLLARLWHRHGMRL